MTSPASKRPVAPDFDPEQLASPGSLHDLIKRYLDDARMNLSAAASLPVSYGNGQAKVLPALPIPEEIYGCVVYLIQNTSLYAVKSATVENEAVNFSLYSLSGETVSTSTHQLNQYGYVEFTTNTSHLPSGVYVYNLSTNNGVKLGEGKLVVVE